MYKKEIINHLCYTELVYQRINKKLRLKLAKSEIQKMILSLIKTTPDKHFKKIGKNYYISNFEKGVRITVNSYTFRVITVDSIL